MERFKIIPDYQTSSVFPAYSKEKQQYDMLRASDDILRSNILTPEDKKLLVQTFTMRLKRMLNVEDENVPKIDQEPSSLSKPMEDETFSTPAIIEDQKKPIHVVDSTPRARKKRLTPVFKNSAELKDHLMSHHSDKIENNTIKLRTGKQIKINQLIKDYFSPMSSKNITRGMREKLDEAKQLLKIEPTKRFSSFSDLQFD